MIDDQLIIKYLKNQCGEKDATLVYKYLKDHPEAMDRFIPLEQILEETDNTLVPDITDRILEKIRIEMGSTKKVSIPLRRFLIWSTAVAAMLLIGLGLYYWNGEMSSKSQVAKIHLTLPEYKAVLKENNLNHPETVYLPDGSVVTLYPKSSLKYVDGFTGNKRELHLKGKAKFKVEHENNERPFTVYVSDIATTDLGTTFVITELNNSKVSVELIEGSVKVWELNKEHRSSVILEPGQKMIVQKGHFKDYVISELIKNKPSTDTKVRGNKKEEAEFIEQGPMVFKNTPLKAVLEKVGQRFNIEFEYNENALGLEDKLFTGTFFNNDSLAFICKVICDAHCLKYDVKGDIVNIHF